MHLQLSLFDLLIIIGMATGLTCGILLLRRSAHKPANRFLGLGILAFVWLNTKTLLHALHLWDIHGLGYFPNAVELALPPLFYYYLITLLHPKRPFGGRDWLHFAPFALSQVYAVGVYVATLQTRLPAEKLAIAQAGHFDAVKQTDEYLSLVMGVVYMFVALPQVWQLYKAPSLSATLRAELAFLRRVLLGLVVVVAYSLVNIGINFWGDVAHDGRWKVSHLLIATLVYYMGLMGFKHSETNLSGVAKRRASQGKPEHRQLIDQLQKLLAQEHLHLNPELKLADLAQRLAVPEAAISQAIKAQYQQNFRAFLSHLRVQAVQQRLTHESASNLSMLGLAQECGFRSEASFYRIFKEVTGQTPKQWVTRDD